MEGVHPTFTLALALAAGVLAQSAARHLKVPGIVLLLLAGVGLGPDGLGWVKPRDLGDGLYAIVELAVSVILFEGGLNLQLSRLRREQASIRRLLTWGALITLFGAAAAVHLFLDWGLARSLVFGSLVVVTGPTVIGPLVAELRLKPRVATVLEAEGVLIDPIGVILAALVLDLVLSPNMDSLAAGGLGLVLRLGFGVIAGVVGGALLAWLLRIRHLVPEGHENILALASVLLLFEGCEALVPYSGILAVTSAGITVGNLPTLVDRDLREFKDQLSVMLIGLLFVMLAAAVRFDHVQALGLGGLAVVGALVFVVRPLGVFISTLGSDLTTRERLFVAWVAPRGIVAAAVASIVAGAFESEGLEGGLELRALVFLTIAATVVLAGLTASPVASWLGVRMPGREGVAILGANPLGMALAEALREGGCSVVFLDSNPHSCRAVEEAGFPVLFGNAIQERTMQRARFETIDTAVALTGNQTLNGVYLDRAREVFGVPKALAAGTPKGGGLVDEMMGRGQADVLFDAPHDVERWEVRWRRGDVEILRRRFREAVKEDDATEQGVESLTDSPSSGEKFVLLARHRGDTAEPISMRLSFSKGDEATVAIHTPEREEALRTLEAMGWWELPEMLDDSGAASKSEESSASGPANVA
jgi:NhaP-type Na+/H+ or K+/H+ antiporter